MTSRVDGKYTSTQLAISALPGLPSAPCPTSTELVISIHTGSKCYQETVPQQLLSSAKCSGYSHVICVERRRFLKRRMSSAFFFNGTSKLAWQVCFRFCASDKYSMAPQVVQIQPRPLRLLLVFRLLRLFSLLDFLGLPVSNPIASLQKGSPISWIKQYARCTYWPIVREWLVVTPLQWLLLLNGEPVGLKPLVAAFSDPIKPGKYPKSRALQSGMCCELCHSYALPYIRFKRGDTRREQHLEDR